MLTTYVDASLKGQFWGQRSGIPMNGIDSSYNILSQYWVNVNHFGIFRERGSCSTLSVYVGIALRRLIPLQITSDMRPSNVVSGSNHLETT